MRDGPEGNRLRLRKLVIDVIHGDLRTRAHWPRSSRQISAPRSDGQRIFTAGGGIHSALSSAQLTAWCDARFRPHAPQSDLRRRPYDLPWLVMDSGDANRALNWRTEVPVEEILEEIASHAELNPEWLERRGV